MKTFEYHTSFVPLSYQSGDSARFLGMDLSGPPQVPNLDSLLHHEGYRRHLNELGSKGWELISAQPVLQGVHTGYSSYSLTAGYFLFWKRETTEVQGFSHSSQPANS